MCKKRKGVDNFKLSNEQGVPGTKLAEYAVPLTFEGAGDTSNARTWSVQVDGVANRAKLTWQNGGLFVPSAGTVVLLR